MNLWEAVYQAMRYDKKIRKTFWGKNGYIYYESGQWFDQECRRYEDIIYTGKDIQWEIYEEPEKKVLYAREYRGHIVFNTSDDEVLNSEYKRAPEFDIDLSKLNGP